MNTKIAKQINEARHSGASLLNEAGKKVVKAHNDAVAYGFLDLPSLVLLDTEILMPNNSASVVVRPACGIMKVSDLWTLKEVWGADDIEVCINNSEAGIAVVFKNR